MSVVQKANLFRFQRKVEVFRKALKLKHQLPKTMIARKTAVWYKSPMTALAQTVLEEAMRLPSVDRAMLIEKLISSFDAAKRKAIDAAWVAESERTLGSGSVKVLQP